MRKSGMVKKLAMTATAAVLTLSMSMITFAGQWRQNSSGWWYDNGNGTWPASSWQWIDGNGDGTAECYYFDQNGYCLMNTTAPGGYTVNASGAWTVNGQVQIRYTGAASQENHVPAREPLMLYDQEPVVSEYFQKWDSAVTNKEHERWAKVYATNSSNTAYIEFYAGGEYESFKAKVAPCDYKSRWEKGNSVYFQVLGDEDELLFEKEIDYRTSAFDLDVDITGQDTVTIYTMVGEGYWNRPVMLNEAKFE